MPPVLGRVDREGAAPVNCSNAAPRGRRLRLMNLFAAHGGRDGEADDPAHGDFDAGRGVEIVEDALQFVRAWPAVAFLGFGDQERRSA